MFLFDEFTFELLLIPFLLFRIVSVHPVRGLPLSRSIVYSMRLEVWHSAQEKIILSVG